MRKTNACRKECFQLLRSWSAVGACYAKCQFHFTTSLNSSFSFSFQYLLSHLCQVNFAFLIWLGTKSCSSHCGQKKKRKKKDMNHTVVLNDLRFCRISFGAKRCTAFPGLNLTQDLVLAPENDKKARAWMIVSIMSDCLLWLLLRNHNWTHRPANTQPFTNLFLMNGGAWMTCSEWA